MYIDDLTNFVNPFCTYLVAELRMVLSILFNEYIIFPIEPVV